MEKQLHTILREIKDNIINEFYEKKYNLILNFITLFFPKKIKDIKEIKRFDIEEFNYNKIKNAFEEYKYKLEGELEINFDDMEINKNVDIIKILNLCLDTINYSVTKKEYDDKLYITIIDKPRKKNEYIRPSTPDEIKEMRKKLLKIKREKEKTFIKFLNNFSCEKTKTLEKIKINKNILQEDKFKKYFEENKDILQEKLCVHFEEKMSIIKILEICCFSLNYMIKKENTYITFIEN